MCRHFKCDKSLSSRCVYSHSVHNGGRWQRHDVLTKGFVLNLAGTLLAKLHLFPFFFCCFPGLWCVSEKRWEKKCSTFQFDLGQSNPPCRRLVRGPSIYVICNVRTPCCCSASKHKSPAIMWYHIRWKLVETKGKKRGEFWTTISNTVAFCNRPLRNVFCGAGGRWHWIEEGILGIDTRVGWWRWSVSFQ